MRLEERDIGVLVEGRPAPEVHRARVTLAVAPDVPAGVHPVSRQTDLAGDLHVRGGEADQPAALVALHHGPTRLERPAEQLRCGLDVPTGERTADRRRRHRFRDTVGPLDEFDGEDLEVPSGADLAQERDVPLPVTSEVEVLPHHDGAGTEHRHQDEFDELLCALTGPRPVERNHDRCVDPGALEQFELLVEVGEQLRAGLWTDDRRGVRVKGDHYRTRPEAGGVGAHLFDDRPVPAVDSVIGTDGDHRARPCPRGSGDVGEHLHGPKG